MQNVTKTNKQTNKHYKEKDNDIWISAVHFSKFFFNTRDCLIDFVRIDWVQHKTDKLFPYTHIFDSSKMLVVLLKLHGH